MSWIRLRVADPRRSEFHLLAGRDLVFGRGEEVDVRLEHDGIARQHARLIIRRDRMVLIDLGRSKTGVRYAGEHIQAPVALENGIPFELGDLQVQAWLGIDREDVIGRVIEGYEVVAELDATDVDHRRFEGVKGDADARVELLVAETTDRAAFSWCERLLEVPTEGGRQLPDLEGRGEIDGRPYLMERVDPGIRLQEVIERVRDAAISVPLEAGLLILAQVAEAAHALNRTFGPHGGIDPRSIHLTANGGVLLLRPGPDPRGFDDQLRRPYLSRRRRYGEPPVAADDAWAVGALGRALADDGWPRALRRVLRSARSPDATLEQLAERLRYFAQEGRLDPSRAHVSRLVRLLRADPSRPLACVRPELYLT